LSEVEGKITLEDENDKSKKDKQNLQIKNDEIIEEMMEQSLIKQIESVIKLTVLFEVFRPMWKNCSMMMLNM
jgi:hypothetical protein